jgi:hypothetical protein
MAEYYGELKPLNQHKIVAIVAHLQWLFTRLRSTRTASRLGRVELVIDRENFAHPIKSCGKLVKAFVSSGLQAAGMSYRLTGRAPSEEPHQGAVTVDVEGDSRQVVGLQLVDILLQVVQRQV